jgi:hypothetical protein
MDRRRLHQAALAWTLTAALPRWGRAQDDIETTLPSGTPPATTPAEPAAPVMRPPADPTLEQVTMGLRFLLEVAVRDALGTPPRTDKLLWDQRLRSVWSEGDWLGEGSRRDERSPWMRYEHFDAVAQLALARTWPQAKDHLMLQVHHLTELDLKLLLSDVQRRPEEGRWATAQFERRAGGQLYTRLLGEIIQVQLNWLRANHDRYPNLPAPRNAQVEMEHMEACQRIGRVLVDSVFYAVALQEQLWRLTPVDRINVPTYMATIVGVLGRPPEKLPFAVWSRPVYRTTPVTAAPPPAVVATASPTSRRKKKKR